MHFPTCSVAIVLISIVSVTSTPVENIATPETGSSFTDPSTPGFDAELDSTSGDQAYVVPGDDANPAVSSDLNPHPGASVLDSIPGSDLPISISDATESNAAEKPYQVAADPSIITKQGAAPVIADCNENASGCTLCIIAPDGDAPCGWFDATCGDPARKYYCSLSRPAGGGNTLVFEATDISHMPSKENLHGQKWCRDCPKPEPKEDNTQEQKKPTCIFWEKICW